MENRITVLPHVFFRALHMLALLCFVSLCLLSTLRVVPLIILILHEITAEKNCLLVSGLCLSISIFQYMHGFTGMLRKVSALPASFSLSFKASLVLSSVFKSSSIIHFSFFCQGRTFAVLTLPFVQLFLPSVYCEYPTITGTASRGMRRGSRDTALLVDWYPQKSCHSITHSALFKPDLKQIKLRTELLSSVKQSFKARRIAHSSRAQEYNVFSRMTPF